MEVILRAKDGFSKVIFLPNFTYEYRIPVAPKLDFLMSIEDMSKPVKIEIRRFVFKKWECEGLAIFEEE